MTSERPREIEKRVFNCTSCGYKVQVYGEQYFDSGCHNYLATYECMNCRILFESLISQIDFDEVKHIAEHNLSEQVICLRCGDSQVKNWNKSAGYCPKCKGEIRYDVVGSIRVRF